MDNTIDSSSIVCWNKWTGAVFPFQLGSSFLKQPSERLDFDDLTHPNWNLPHGHQPDPRVDLCPKYVRWLNQLYPPKGMTHSQRATYAWTQQQQHLGFSRPVGRLRGRNSRPGWGHTFFLGFWTIHFRVPWWLDLSLSGRWCQLQAV